LTDNKHQESQQTTTGGILEAGKETLTAALNTAQQVAHSVGEKLGIVSPTEEKKEECHAGAAEAHNVHTKDLEAAKSTLNMRKHRIKVSLLLIVVFILRKIIIKLYSKKLVNRMI